MTTTSNNGGGESSSQQRKQRRRANTNPKLLILLFFVVLIVSTTLRNISRALNIINNNDDDDACYNTRNDIDILFPTKNTTTKKSSSTMLSSPEIPSKQNIVKEEGKEETKTTVLERQQPKSYKNKEGEKKEFSDDKNRSQSGLVLSTDNDSSSTSSLNCRLAWDIEKKKYLINHWLEMELPILISAIRHERKTKKRQTDNDNDDISENNTNGYYQNTQNDLVYVIFTQRPHKQKGKVMDFLSTNWMCLYGQEQKQQEGQELAAFAPHNKGDDVILMCNATIENSTMELKGIFPTTMPSYHRNRNNNTTTTTTTIATTTKTEKKNSNIHTDSNPYIYNLKASLECDRLEEQETSNIHTEKKIGACIRFKGEFDRLHIPQWIEYHRLLGVEHFWVYMNEEWNVTGLYNQSYVTYMPFDLNWNNHFSYFPHHYADAKPKLSQEPASWQCMFNARKYNYDWVITTDVDEYIHVPKNSRYMDTNINNETATITTTTTNMMHSLPLQSYLTRFDPRQYSSLIMKSIPFGRNIWSEPDPRPSSSDHPFLLIDYVWRRDLNLSEYGLYRQKQIYNPQHVWSIGVHYCWVAEGKKNVVLKPEDGLFIQHYKLSPKGVYKKFEKLMIKSVDDLRLDSELRDNYRDDLVVAMKELGIN